MTYLKFKINELIPKIIEHAQEIVITVQFAGPIVSYQSIVLGTASRVESLVDVGSRVHRPVKSRSLPGLAGEIHSIVTGDREETRPIAAVEPG